MSDNDHLFGKEQFIQFTARAFRKLLSIYVFSFFSFGFEGRIWDLIVSVPDHCLSFYFAGCLKLLHKSLIFLCNKSAFPTVMGSIHSFRETTGLTPPHFVIIMLKFESIFKAER